MGEAGWLAKWKRKHSVETCVPSMHDSTTAASLHGKLKMPKHGHLAISAIQSVGEQTNDGIQVTTEYTGMSVCGIYETGLASAFGQSFHVFPVPRLQRIMQPEGGGSSTAWHKREWRRQETALRRMHGWGRGVLSNGSAAR